MTRAACARLGACALSLTYLWPGAASAQAAAPTGLAAWPLGNARVGLGWDEPSADAEVVAHRIYVENIQGRPDCVSSLLVSGQEPDEDLQFFELGLDGGQVRVEGPDGGTRSEIEVDGLTPNNRHAFALAHVDDAGNTSVLSALACANSSVIDPDAPRGCSIGIPGAVSGGLAPLAGVLLLARRRRAAVRPAGSFSRSP